MVKMQRRCGGPPRLQQWRGPVLALRPEASALSLTRCPAWFTRDIIGKCAKGPKG